eukprot:6492322-Amphidinium_carterae.1
MTQGRVHGEPSRTLYICAVHATQGPNMADSAHRPQQTIKANGISPDLRPRDAPKVIVAKCAREIVLTIPGVHTRHAKRLKGFRSIEIMWWTP